MVQDHPEKQADQAIKEDQRRYKALKFNNNKHSTKRTTEAKHTPAPHQQVCFSCSRLFETASSAIYCDGCSAQKLLNKMEALNG